MLNGQKGANAALMRIRQNIVSWNDSILRLGPGLPVYAEEHLLTVTDNSFGCRKICKLKFRPDGSLFVHVPYFQDKKGFICRVTGRLLDDGAVIESVEERHTISWDAKLSCHSDGRIHFSQDAKLRTVVKQKLVPLERHDSVLFQVRAFGFTGYKTATMKERRTDKKRAWHDWPVPEGEGGVVLTGYVCKPGATALESIGTPLLVARSDISAYWLAVTYSCNVAPGSYTGSHLLLTGGPTDPALSAPGSSRDLIIAVYPRGASAELYSDSPSADYHGS